MTKPVTLDLISDLHIDLWGGLRPDYARGQRSDIVVVAGDIHRNPEGMAEELRRIAAVYPTVLFVDGNNEFRDAFLTDANFDVAATEDAIRKAIAGIPNIHYLKDGAFVAGGVAIIGRNGHWNHQADPAITQDEAIEEQARVFSKGGLKRAFNKVAPVQAARGIVNQAQRDFEDLRDEVVRLNADPRIHTIVTVTHTVPARVIGDELLEARSDASPWRSSVMANTRLQDILHFDDKHKIRYWLFGHQHGQHDVQRGQVRFMENPLGRPGEMYTPETIVDYKPMTVKIDAPGRPRDYRPPQMGITS